MSDSNGYRPVFDDEETQKQYDDWVWEKQQVKARSATRSAYIKGVVQSTITSTRFGVGENVVAGATLGHVTIPYGKIQIPVKLSAFENVGKFFKVFSAISLCSSLRDNFSGKYDMSEAWIRTAIDVGAFAAGIAFTAGGGWAAVGIGLGIGLAAESIKYRLDAIVYKKQVAY